MEVRTEVKGGHLLNDCSRLYLLEHDQGHGSQRGEENGNNDHDDAHWDAFIEAGQSRDPPTMDENQMAELPLQSERNTRVQRDSPMLHLALIQLLTWCPSS